MAFQKFRADQLFDGYRLLDDNHVLIMDDGGTVQEIVPLAEAGDDVRQFSGILSPGFINCHCHLELSHMRGLIPEGTGLAQFVFNVIKQRHFPEEEILAAIKKAEDEMLDNGIVAVGDICNNMFTLPQKSQGRMRYHNFIEASGFDPSIVETRFQHSLGLFNAYAHPRSIVPHAPYSVADELWQKIIHFPGNHLLTIHNQETAAEDDLFVNGTGEFLELYEKLGVNNSLFKPSGKSSLQTILPRFRADQSLILVHNVHTSEDDLRVCHSDENKRRQLSWCLCPKANLYIGGRLPHVMLLAGYSDNIVLGTDSLASNGALSIAGEMKAIKEIFPSVTFQQLFSWATLNGAKALKMQQMLGSFEKGKKPGLVICSPDLSMSNKVL